MHDQEMARPSLNHSMNHAVLIARIATKLVNRMIIEAKKNGIRKLEAESAVDNIASVRLAKKLGFVIEGTKKSALKVGNKYVDSYILGKILK